MLRRTIDAEGEGLHVTDLLKESHSRIADLTNNSDNHLEKLMKQHDERLRNHQSKMDAESAEKILASVTKCNLEKLELEEKLSYLSSESNHKLKTCILETEQRIHEREAENTRALKTAARDAETANENYKHQVSHPALLRTRCSSPHAQNALLLPPCVAPLFTHVCGRRLRTSLLSFRASAGRSSSCKSPPAS